MCARCAATSRVRDEIEYDWRRGISVIMLLWAADFNQSAAQSGTINSSSISSSRTWHIGNEAFSATVTIC